MSRAKLNERKALEKLSAEDVVLPSLLDAPWRRKIHRAIMSTIRLRNATCPDTIFNRAVSR
jgi:hypothetical protein